MLSFLACCFISALPMLQKVVGVSSLAAVLSEFVAFPSAAMMVVDVGNFLQKRLKIYFLGTMLKILDFALLILMRPQKECKRQ